MGRSRFIRSRSTAVRLQLYFEDDGFGTLTVPGLKASRTTFKRLQLVKGCEVWERKAFQIGDLRVAGTRPANPCNLNGMVRYSQDAKPSRASRHSGVRHVPLWMLRTAKLSFGSSCCQLHEMRWWSVGTQDKSVLGATPGLPGRSPIPVLFWPIGA